MSTLRCIAIAAASLTVFTTGGLAQIRTLPPGSNGKVAAIPKPATTSIAPGQYSLTLTVTNVGG